MKLLIIRHAIAMEREEFHKFNTDDEQRPLILEGIKKMRKNAKGLRKLVPYLQALYASPLVRAEQTARIVSDEYDGIAIAKTDSLKPESNPDDLLQFLKSSTKDLSNTEKDEAVVAVVGHEPHLSELIGYLLTGNQMPLFELKKGGASMFDLKNGITAGKAELEWVVKPSLLRKLA